MLLVVFQHIRYFSIGMDLNESALAQFCITFRMPMFFFIAGYMAYKTVDNWTASFYKRRLMTKARVQLVPTIVFFCVYCILRRSSGNLSFPAGFWFTESLFEMFVAYFSIACLSNKFGGKFEEIALFCVVVFTLGFNRCFPGAYYIYGLSLGNTCHYFVYFALGLMMKKHQGLFFRIIQSQVAITVMMLLSGMLLVLLFKYGTFDSYTPLLTASMYLVGIMLVFVIFASFHKNVDFWNKDSWLQNSLEYVGRRTLDIYMLHYFFLPNLHWLKGVLRFGYSDIVLEFFVVGLLTLMVVACSLLVSNLLRTSSVVTKWLFGVSPKPLV